MALTLLAANNASTLLVSGISAVSTTLQVSTGTGDLFPSPVPGTSYFKLTLTSLTAGETKEIVYVTARSGDTLTIIRGQEGTAAASWDSGASATNLITAGTFNEMAQQVDVDQVYTDLASTAAGKGTELVFNKSPLAGAVARSQRDKNNDSVTTADFGSIGDGTIHPLSEKFATLTAAQVVYSFVTALTQSIDWAAFQAALNSGKPVEVIGNLVCTDKLTSNNKNVVIFTPGIAGASVKFSNTTGGFDFTFKPQNSTPPQYLSIWGLDITTDVAVTTPAIRASWGVRQPNASGQCTIENVRILSGDSTTGSFEAGIDLIYAIRVFLNKVQILGDNARTGNDAFRAQGCVEINHTDCLANRYKCPAHIKKYNSADQQTEGIWFKGCWFYDCSMGIYSPDQSIHISIIETFINPNGTASVPISNIASIDIANCSQFVIENNVIYIGGLSTDGANQDAVRISGLSTGGALGNNQLVAVQKANSRYGAVVSGTILYSQFCNNKISGFTNEGINITASTCKGNVVAENMLYDCGGAWIADSGTGTIKFGNTKCAALDVPHPLNPLLVNSTGLGGQGSISGDTNWGMLLYPADGVAGHIALCDASDTAVASTFTGRAGFRIYSKSSLPSASLWAAGAMAGFIFVSDDVGGFTPAFSDGTNWRRMADRNVIS
ncbi:hypothetical protein ACFPZP_13905 [Citrobacter bitternis]|uniref:Uncharacterized protein n=1 Tax=Citrobacter bitternis TaxID=1585982 RepID=A0ABW1Q164_9ENTR